MNEYGLAPLHPWQAAISVYCPHCSSAAGTPCDDMMGHELARPHSARLARLAVQFPGALDAPSVSS